MGQGALHGEGKQFQGGGCRSENWSDLRADGGYSWVTPTRDFVFSAGLIVLAAVTPESSLDSGHETNSSELTDVSEMVSAMKQNQNTACILARHIGKENLLARKDLPFRLQGCAAQAILTSPYTLRHLQPGPAPKVAGGAGQSKPEPSRLGRSYTLAIQPLLSPQLGGSQSKGIQTPTSERRGPGPPKAASIQVSLPTTAPAQSTEQGLQDTIPQEVRLGPKPVTGAGSRVLPAAAAISSALQQELSHKAAQSSTITTAEPLSASGSHGCRPQAGTGSLRQSVSQPAPEHPCPAASEPSPRPSRSQSGPTEVLLHTLAGDDPPASKSSRLKGSQGPVAQLGSEELAQQDRDKAPSSAGQRQAVLVSPGGQGQQEACARSCPRSPADQGGGIPRSPSEESQGKGLAGLGAEGSSVPPKPPEKALEGSPQEADVPAKPRVPKAPFRLRRLFSATFPARLKKETDERQAQLQKVKQYELEFLEELLKPRSKGDPPPPEFLLPPAAPGRCGCQLRTSPVQKVPGMSREQRRSCDCKRLSRGALPQPGQGTAAPKLERRGREKAPKQVAEVRGTSIRSPCKGRRVRSTSLEARDCRSGPEQSLSCLTTCTSRGGECMGAPQYRKLMRRYSISELDKTDQASLASDIYQCTYPTQQKPLQKDEEATAPVPTPKSKAQEAPSTGTDPSYIHIAQEKKSQKEQTVFSLQEDVYPSSAELPEEDPEGGRCCSIRYCFYYRKCGVADDGSERDELSYSIPMQILPGMKLDSQALPVVSRTLQVLDATACSSPDDHQTQEIDLRTSTFEGSLAKIHTLRGRTYTLPDGFLAVQLDTSELLTILRQCAVHTEAREGRPYLSQLVEYKQELALKFKEFRASCRRVAAVDKSPTHMLSAVTSSFQMLGSLMETFVRLVCVVRSEAQRQALLRKVEEVVRNYTFLLRAAEESTARTAGHTDPLAEQLSRQSVSSVMSTFTRSLKTLMNK